LAGSYTNNWYGDYTEDFLLGRTEREYGAHSDKTELLGCTCGCRGCWPLAVRITVSEEMHCVTWDSFEQPHREWDYSGLGPFCFELEQYLNEIRKIPQEKNIEEPPTSRQMQRTTNRRR
jgi:hypothetical protein